MSQGIGDWIIIMESASAHSMHQAQERCRVCMIPICPHEVGEENWRRQSQAQAQSPS